jgi:hypothetical protein
VVYAQHGGGERAEWDDDKVRKEDGRPVIYTPQGSHGSLYGPDLALGKGEPGTGFGCDDATPPSVRLVPGVRLVPQAVSGPDDPYAWITYEGRWGERLSGEFNGPTGPNTKRAWTDPVGWQSDQRDSSLLVPESAIGPNAAAAFCGVVSAGADLLSRWGPAALVVLLGAAVASAGITVRRTQFRPVIAQPLARRRRFGQILRSAFRVFRARAGLMFSIGAAFIPLGMAASALQQVVVTNKPVEPVLDTLDASAASGVVALALGGLAFGIGYWLVLCATVGVLGEIDARSRPTLRTAFRIVRANLGRLVSARLRALAIIMALGITVVGLPVAIRLAVRWMFLEQAILLEGASARSARHVSARLVAGAWWRTLGFSIVVGGGAVVVGPIVGMAVLLLTSASLPVVNLVSSVFYVMLVPYAAIAFTMLFCDLQCEKAMAASQADPQTDYASNPSRTARTPAAVREGASILDRMLATCLFTV